MNASALLSSLYLFGNDVGLRETAQMIRKSDPRSAYQLDRLPRCDDHIDHGYALSPSRSPSVLGILVSPKDSQLLEAIAKDQGWKFGVANSWAEGLGIVEEYRLGVVLMLREILGIDWREGLQLFLQPSHRSNVLLVSDTPVNSFSQRFLEEGGFAVLSSPLQKLQVLNEVQRAWAAWKNSIAAPYGY